MVDKELKQRIKLIRTLKAAQDEAKKIQNKIIRLHRDAGTISDDLEALIKRVNDLDKKVVEEET